ncbi:MAG: hypothetical protein OEN01_12995 [Candidatus Krumholzibacteria bacterium]|nr:hypothetical protein [Candidatus Krumholzibacteria bacterium]
MRAQPRRTTTGQREVEVIGDLLVTGCPRSGTKYTARLLTELGRRIGHEQLERDGIASWCMAVAADKAPWGPARQEHQTFEVIFHQVRNPRFVIPSMSTMEEVSWEFICAHTPCDPAEPRLLREAKLWYHWNLLADEIAHWRYRIEDLDSVFPEFCTRARVPCDSAVLERVGVNINSRAYRGLPALVRRASERIGRDPPAFIRKRFVDRRVYEAAQPFDWSVVRALDRNVFDQVISLATFYGYTPAEVGCP